MRTFTDILGYIGGTYPLGSLSNQIQQSQPGYTQQELAQAQQQALEAMCGAYNAQLQQLALLPYIKVPNVWRPIVQEELDALEAEVEVDRIAPGFDPEVIKEARRASSLGGLKWESIVNFLLKRARQY